MLASLLKMAGMGQDDQHMHDMTDDNSQMLAIQTMGDEDACSSCGSSPCGCDDEMYEGLYDTGAKLVGAAAKKFGPEVEQMIAQLSKNSGHEVDTIRNVFAKQAAQKAALPGPSEAGYQKLLDKIKNQSSNVPPVDEAYGDTDATENEPDWPTDEEGTEDAMMYSGGLNGPKSTGQTTIPVIAGQKDRMGYNGLDEELGRMLKIAGISGH
jgi:hypothetical protein